MGAGDGAVSRGGFCRASVLAASWFVHAVIAGAAMAQVQGTVIFNDGTKTVSGVITSVSPLLVEVGEKRFPIERIANVEFDDEPTSLKAARRSVILRGDARQAGEDLANIGAEDFDNVEQLVRDELTFVKAAVEGLKGLQAGGAQLGAAEKAVRDYLAKHGASSHHAFFMHELNGRILSRAGKFDEATKAYVPFDKGPPAYQVRGKAARGGLLVEQGKFAEAMAEYSAAAKTETNPNDEASTRQKQEAELGIARCLARLAKPQEAIAMVQEVLKSADPEEADLLARGYNVLGDAYRAAGKDQDAVISYLTVDLVYNSSPQNREEALYNLVQLWERGKFAERARATREQLESTYPNSPWVRKLKTGGAAAP
jgi:tetratricopeptide (TPR) repeat protein